MFQKIVNNELLVGVDNDDNCLSCVNQDNCPLIQALNKQVVVLHYSNIDTKDCEMFISDGKEFINGFTNI